MKTTIQKLGMIICSLILLVSCTKDEGQIVSKPDTTPVSETSVLKFSGMLENRLYKGSGTVNIYLDGGKYILKFSNLVVDGGPDLKVYLSKTEDTKDIINLGKFEANTIYAIPETATVSDYKNVLIYCQQYSKLFVAAPLTAK